MTTKTIATAPTSLRPVTVALAREGRDAQHINAIPRKGVPAQQKIQNTIGRCDLPPVLRERQSVLAARDGRLPDIVVPLPQVVRDDFIAE
jgi:hypothetical protein